MRLTNVRFLTIGQATEWLRERGIPATERKVRMWIRAGALAGKKWRGMYLTTEAALERLIQELADGDGHEQ